MSPIKISGQGSVDRLFTQVRLTISETSAAITTQLPDLMEGIVEQGVVDMKDIITNAVTPTGEKRAAAGKGIAGRVETDEMRQEVVGEVQVDTNSVTGRWGWLQQYEDRFGIQEDGFGAITPMHALLGSFLKGRETLRSKILDIVKGATK